MAETRLHCELTCFSTAVHLYQLYSGFGELEAKGLIDLVMRPAANFAAHPHGRCALHVVLNGSKRIFYDTQDTSVLDAGVDLSNIDYYFKRSLPPNPQLTHAPCELRPLGLNYAVVSPHCLLPRMARWPRSILDRIKCWGRAHSGISKLLNLAHSAHSVDIGKIESLPQLSRNPRILFMSRLWDPAGVRSDRKREERFQLNRVRIQCVRVLRRRFGDAFTGGFARDEFSLREAPDCVFDSPRTHGQVEYLRRLATSDICVQTEGLEGSIGFKLGEYVASAKAIVTERVNHALPGNFRVGRNYLEFGEPEECVEKVETVLHDSRLRYEMMVANLQYYHEFLRPDVMVLNSLRESLQPVSAIAPEKELSGAIR